MNRLSTGCLSALIIGAALAAAVFSWWMSLAPRPLLADAHEDAFSAHRAIRHIEAMAIEPHPGGSHALERLYAYITAELKRLGVETRVERPVRKMRDNTVERNGAILARVPGTASTGAFAVDTHIDSTPYGPGAADDLSGAAAMLETIRALTAGPPLMNDMIFCFADKEEMGGPGGPEVFIEHPWFSDVKAVLGLETRGTAGPALMFETGPENGFMIRQLARSEAHPRATSIMFDIFDRMPFSSNFSHYKREGLPGMNVAYIDDFCNYHTKLDTLENVSLASLQHHGYYTLGLCRQIGNIPLDDCKAPSVTYFNTIGSHMIVYPQAWGRPLAQAILAVFACVLVFGFVRRCLTFSGTLAGTLLFPLAVVPAIILTAPMAALVFYLLREHALYRNNSFSIGFVLIGLGIFALFARLVSGRVRPHNLLAGTLLWWAAGLLAMERWVPGGTYAILWPLLMMTAGLFALLCARDPERPSNTLIAAASATVLPGIVLLIPAFVMFSYTLTALSVPLLLMPLLLLAATLLPALTLIPARRLVHAGLGLATAGLMFYIGAFLTNTSSASRPRQNCLAYAVNFDSGEAYWLSGDKKIDEWTSKYIPADAPWVSIADFLGHDDGYTYRRAPAPMPPFGKTTLKVLEDRTENGRRYLRLHVDSPRDAQWICLRLESDAKIYKSVALGIELDGGGGGRRGWNISFDTIPFEGGELELEAEAGKPLTFLVREVSCTLPDLPGFAPRPAHLMPQTNRRLDRTRKLDSEHSYSIGTYTY